MYAAVNPPRLFLFFGLNNLKKNFAFFDHTKLVSSPLLNSICPIFQIIYLGQKRVILFL